MLNPFRRTYTQIQFTDGLIEQLESVLTEAYNILKDSAYTAQANFLKQILSSVMDRDTERFKKLVLSNELLGGAGSVLDCWIEDEQQMLRLQKLETELYHLFKEAGLKHRALKRLKW